MTGSLFPGQNLAHGGQSSTCSVWCCVYPQYFLRPSAVDSLGLLWSALWSSICSVTGRDTYLAYYSMDMVRSKLDHEHELKSRKC